MKRHNETFISKVSELILPVIQEKYDDPVRVVIENPDFICGDVLLHVRVVLTGQNLKWHERHAAGVTLCYFPGCCMYGIITNMFVRHVFRKRGLGKLLLDHAETVLADMEYTSAIATIIRQMGNMEKLLLSSGYELNHEHCNNNTGNLVKMFYKDIKEYTGEYTDGYADGDLDEYDG